MVIAQAEVNRRAIKTYQDMYEGENSENPPMTVRMDRVERAIATMNKLTWTVIGLAVIVLGDIISQHVK
jgi:hypothetical protein